MAVSKDKKSEGENRDTQSRLKEKEKRRLEKEKLERKKMYKIVSFPFKTLSKLSTVIGLLTFIIMYFGMNTELIDAIYYAFLAFSVFYLGVGLIIVMVLMFLTDQRKKEIEEKRKLNEERRKQDELKKEEETARLEQLKQRTTLDDIRTPEVNQAELNRQRNFQENNEL